MRSFLREILIELVNSSSELILELLRPHGDFGRLEGLTAKPFSIELVSAPQHRPDHVTLFHDGAGTPVHAVIVDVQLHVDTRKPWIWPVYVTATFAALRCPVTLLVIAPEPHVARWARSPGEERPGPFLAPLVVSYRDVPRVVDPEVVRRLPELALLSALAHPSAEVVRAAAAGIAGMAEKERARRYLAAMKVALPEDLHGEMEAEGRHLAELRAREPLRGAIHQMSQSRLGKLSRDDEMAVSFAASDNEPAIQLIVGLAWAQDAAQAREAIHKAATEHLHAVRAADAPGAAGSPGASPPSR